ncbi:hypothetical protein P7K49_019079, partial [Saguinus oedipus]
ISAENSTIKTFLVPFDIRTITDKKQKFHAQILVSFEDVHNLFDVFFAVSIYGIWFYDKEECQRIAELMKNLTQYEQLKAHQGTGAGISPMILNSGEGKEVDILQMLIKAKDEYTK